MIGQIELIKLGFRSKRLIHGLVARSGNRKRKVNHHNGTTNELAGYTRRSRHTASVVPG